jgi:hypothetical protein
LTGIIDLTRLTCLVLALLTVTLVVHTGAAEADALNWAPGVVLVPPADAGANPDVVISSLSCPSTGNCAAVGSFQDAAGNAQGLLASESAGHWSVAAEAQAPANANAVDPDVSLTYVSCASAQNCTAVGSYIDRNSLTQGLRLTETNGSWSVGTEVIHPQSVSVATNPQIDLTFVSCANATNCFIAGTYTDSNNYPQGLLETEINGSWAATKQAGLPTDHAAEAKVALTSGSCGAVNTCVAVGSYLNNANERQGLLLSGSVSGGTWTFAASTASLPAGAAAGPNVSLNSVSCAAAGACDAVGSYEDSSNHQQGLLLSESGGSWGTGTAAALPPDASSNPGVSLNSVSCSSAGDCDAVGDYDAGVGALQGLMLTQTSGSWGSGAEPTLPPDAGSPEFVTLSSVSCSASSVCAATGNYADDLYSAHPLLLSQSSAGSWSAGVEPTLPYSDAAPDANVEALSCAAGGDCSAVAQYTDQAGDQLAGASNGTVSAASTPALSLGTPPTLAESGIALPAGDFSASLSGGAGESGTLTFNVFGPQDSAPISCAYGGATVGNATVSADGTYVSPSGFTPAAAGDYWWYASYGGDLQNASALSPCGALMDETQVQTPTLSLAAPLTTTLDASIPRSAISALLSSASSNASGTLTFTVFGPQSAPPTACAGGGGAIGTATVQGNGRSDPSGGFTPAAPGDYWWYVSYGGDPSNPAAASGCGSGMAQTVVRAAPTLSLSAAATVGTVGVAVPSPASANLLGGVNEGGAVTFSVFGPQASAPVSCQSAAVVGSATVVGDGTYTPAAAFTPSAAGDYWWYASYGGDDLNYPAASACGAQMHETVVSEPATVSPPPTTTNITRPAPVASTRTVKLTTSGNVVKVTTACRAASSQSCVYTVTVTATESRSAKAISSSARHGARRRTVTIGTGTFRLRGGTIREVSLKLNRLGTKLLATNRKLSALVRLRQGHTTLRRGVTLHVRPSAKRRRRA